MKRKIKNILVAVQQRNLLSYIPTTIFTVVAAVISIPILTRWFTPEIYGKYALVLAGISLSTTLGGGWLYQSILRYYTGELETGEWRLFFKLSLLGSLVIVSFSIPLWYIFVEFRDYSIAASLFIFLCIPFRTINVMDRVEEHPFRYSIWDSGLNAGKLLLGILIIWQTNRRLGMQSIFWAGSVIMIFGLINLLTVKVTQLRNLKKPIVSAKKLLSYGLPLALAQLSVWLFSMSDTFLLKVFHDNATVGIFSVVNGLINRTIHIIPVAIMLAAWPTLVKIFRKSGWPLAVREHASQVKIYLFIMLPVIFVFLVFAKSGYQLFVHEKYWAGTIIILPLTIGTFLLGLSQYYLNTFNLAEQSHKVTLVLLVTGGLKVIISFCLVPHYSYIGASWATCIAYGILAFWSIYWSHRTFGVNLPWQKG